MSKANDKLTEGLIYAEMFNGVTEITRKRISEMHRNQKSAEGRDVTKGSGSNTSNVMKQVALKEPSYTFVDSGRDKHGRHINPRLVKTLSHNVGSKVFDALIKEMEKVNCTACSTV